MLQRFRFLLHRCAKSGQLHVGQCLHAALFKFGFDSDVILSNHLINLYARCGRISTARKVFAVMQHRNLVSWSSIISGCDKAGKSPAALCFFSRMPFLPNEYVYASAISASARQCAFGAGRQIHARSLKTGHSAISFVCNSLISLYMKCGFPDDAQTIFTCMADPNVVSFNAMIAGSADNLQFQKSLDLFKFMTRRGLRADEFTLVAVLGALVSPGEVDVVHCLILKLRLDSSSLVGNTVLALYSKYGSLLDSEKIFQRIEDKDVVSCNTFMAACTRHGDHARSLNIFRAMAELDGYAFAGALAASAGLASINHGSQIHAKVLRTGAASSADVALHNSLLNMYAKCGKMGYAETIFRLLPEKNLVSWNTMIAGLGSNGRGTRALELFAEMIAEGLSPDSCTFSGLLTACSHSGMVDQGRQIYHCMAEVFGINPGVEHLSSLIDLLGRAGRLEEAERYLEEEEGRSIRREGGDAVTRGSLLSSCRIHGDVITGRKVAERLLEAGPRSSSPYVLLSSLYATTGRWGEASRVRRQLRGSGLSKQPGHSLVDVADGRPSIDEMDDPRLTRWTAMDNLDHVARKLRGEEENPNPKN